MGTRAMGTVPLERCYISSLRRTRGRLDCLSSIILSPLNGNVKMSPPEPAAGPFLPGLNPCIRSPYVFYFFFHFSLTTKLLCDTLMLTFRHPLFVPHGSRFSRSRASSKSPGSCVQI